MNELELLSIIKETGIDISDCVISIRQTNEDRTIDEGVVLVTSANGSIEHQFVKEQLFPDNVSGERVYNASNLQHDQVSSENKKIYAELTPLVLPETSVSFEWPSKLPSARAQNIYHEEMLPSFEVPLKVGRTAKHMLAKNHERRKRKSSSDVDYVYEGEESYSESSSSGEMWKGNRGFKSKKRAKLGKSRSKKNDAIVVAQPKLDKVLFSYPKKVHDFEKGRFVLERGDMYKTDNFNIWKINDNKMLVKYEPMPGNANIFRSTKKYRGFTRNIANEYVAIKVNRTGENAISFKNNISPEVSDESLDESPVVQLFTVYVQCLVSHAIDSEFLSSIKIQNEEYHLESVNQIDSILEKAQELVSSKSQWDPNFRRALDIFPFYTVSALVISTPENLVCCQARNDSTVMATTCLSLYGPCYDYQILRTDPNSLSNAEGNLLYYLSDSELTLAITYHSVRHYKYHLFQDSEKEVAMRLHSKKCFGTEIVTNVLDNKSRIRHFYGQLVNVLQSCGLGLESD